LPFNGCARTGQWQITGKCHFRFGIAWRPNQNPLQRDQPNVHVLTDELMDRIYSLVHETQMETLCASPSSLNPIHQW
jgi:hypothetical protein